jgi:hypothetical protein
VNTIQRKNWARSFFTARAKRTPMTSALIVVKNWRWLTCSCLTSEGLVNLRIHKIFQLSPGILNFTPICQYNLTDECLFCCGLPESGHLPQLWRKNIGDPSTYASTSILPSEKNTLRLHFKPTLPCCLLHCM